MSLDAEVMASTKATMIENLEKARSSSTTPTNFRRRNIDNPVEPFPISPARPRKRHVDLHAEVFPVTPTPSVVSRRRQEPLVEVKPEVSPVQDTTPRASPIPRRGTGVSRIPASVMNRAASASATSNSTPKARNAFPMPKDARVPLLKPTRSSQALVIGRPTATKSSSIGTAISSPPPKVKKIASKSYDAGIRTKRGSIVSQMANVFLNSGEGMSTIISPRESSLTPSLENRVAEPQPAPTKPAVSKLDRSRYQFS